MAPTTFIYTVTRTDFAQKAATSGNLHLLDVYASIDAAKTAAKAHLAEQSEDATSDSPEINESASKDAYTGTCFIKQGQRNHFTVAVTKMEVKHEVPKVAKPARAKAPARKAKKAPEPEEDDDDEEEADDDDGEAIAPVKKPATTTKPDKKTVPEGKPNALAGLKVLFTGTFTSMDRKTSKITAEKYGATIITKLEDCDYVIMGVRAGENKIAEIQKKGLDTVDEDGFFDLLRDGIPEWKQAKMADREDVGPPKKRSKT